MDVRGRGVRWLAACLLLGALDGAADPSGDGNADPWVGRTRDEVVRLFGPPDRTKPRAEGGETLTYKVIRLEEGTDPGPEVIVVALPGVGQVGRRFVETPGALPGLTYEPVIYDESGRPIGGGRTETQHYEKSISTKKKSKQGEPAAEAAAEEQSLEPAPPTQLSGKRIKLLLHLDATGRVVSWATS